MRTKVKVMIVFIAVIAVSFIGYNVYKAQSTKLLSDIAMANVEALATPEGDDWVKENLDTTCAYCINMVGGHGVFFYCQYGTGSCYNPICTSGYCW